MIPTSVYILELMVNIQKGERQISPSSPVLRRTTGYVQLPIPYYSTGSASQYYGKREHLFTETIRKNWLAMLGSNQRPND